MKIKTVNQPVWIIYDALWVKLGLPLRKWKRLSKCQTNKLESIASGVIDENNSGFDISSSQDGKLWVTFGTNQRMGEDATYRQESEAREITPKEAVLIFLQAFKVGERCEVSTDDLTPLIVAIENGKV